MAYIKHLPCLAVCVFFMGIFSSLKAKVEEKPIAVVIPSYNNEEWVEKNLKSAFSQQYENYQVIYINDCSTDHTLERVYQIIEQCNQWDRTTVINNEKRCGAMANWYTTIQNLPDNVIVVQVDGDDFLANNQVLSYINKVYANPSIWLTYGQFIEYPSNIIRREYSKPFSQDVINRNAFRSVGQLPISHLRTFYAWLFKAIKLEDVLFKGQFYPMTCDKVMMACMIEMAAHHHYCVPDALYIYNTRNQICDYKVNQKLQHDLAWHILRQAPYPQLSEPMSVESNGNESATLIILSDNPSNIEQTISSVGPLDGVYVLVAIEEIARLIPNTIGSIAIKPVSYGTSSIKSILADIIQSNTSEYFLLQDASGDNDIENIDLKTCIRFLKKTQCKVFDLTNCENTESVTLPRVNHEYKVYAEQGQLKENTQWQITLWDKESLLQAITNMTEEESNSSTKALTRWISQQNKLALTF